MPAASRRKHRWLIGLVAFLLLAAGGQARAAAKVYVVLWFDTEDYLLPASDDAALRVADFLAGEKVRATFKVVGEKARTLERRRRTDVIDALKKHEIGYHSNYHSVEPTPALYLSDLGWDEGVREFDRREYPGYQDVKRVFGQAPSCYGQPGSSWGPQSFGAMRKWGMPVYLDAGNHVGLDGKPFYYCGILNLYHLTYTLRTNLGGQQDLDRAEQQFLGAREKLLAEGGGIVSIFYHPCEFVHKKFWDGVNFDHGANPPRSQWKEPPQKTAEETRAAFDNFTGYIRFIKHFPDVHFITATEAAKLYRDRAEGRTFTREELREIAAKAGDAITFQKRGDLALSAGEIFALLNEFIAQSAGESISKSIQLPRTPFGPSNPVPTLDKPVTTDWSQFTRTAADVSDFLRKQGRVPTSVWLGSVSVPPEAYLRALAQVAQDLADGKRPEKVEIRPAKLAAATYVAADAPNLWGWVIFPKGFRAPAMMELAKRQAWTIKPAMIDPSSN